LFIAVPAARCGYRGARLPNRIVKSAAAVARLVGSIAGSSMVVPDSLCERCLDHR
jgi:hypothetical protein